MNKKERDRIKRKRKQQEERKRQARIKYQVIADETQPITCYVNSDWRTGGMANVLVLKTLRSGGHAMGAFLIDLWCCGLKDAWGRLEITSSEFEETLKRGESLGIDPVSLDVETARRLVAGAIRFATRNGFRLPARYQRWVAMLGISADSATEVDLSGFGVEGGKLRFVGQYEDLGRRLVRQSIDDFLARPDVEFVARYEEDDEESDYEEEDYEDEDYEEEDYDEDEEDVDSELESEQALVEAMELAGGRLADAVRKACFARGEAPSPMLDDAASAILDALMQMPGLPQDETEKLSAEVMDTHVRLVNRAMELHGQEEEPELRRALEQVRVFIQANPSAREFTRALGFDEEDEAAD